MNYTAIAAAMQAEIDDSKTLYMPCSPGEFVRDRLFIGGFYGEAVWFWSHYCSGGFFGPELDDLYLQLQKLAKNETMPDWGTKGT